MIAGNEKKYKKVKKNLEIRKSRRIFVSVIKQQTSLTINFQTMYRVIFYKKKTDSGGNISMERISLDSGCTTLAEAFSFAVNNGADPNKNILYKWIEQ